MINLEKYNVKKFSSSSLKELNETEKIKWKEFLVWFTRNIEQKNISLLYRGTTKKELKDRVASSYRNDDDYMKYLFSWGEKSKSFLKKNKKNNSFLRSIESIGGKTFSLIFSKIKEIINLDSIIVKHFNQNNPNVFNYFKDGMNKGDFIIKILGQELTYKIKIRNYYLRLIHTIFELGHKNEFSIFVSTSFDFEIAKNFSVENDGITILYWVANPIERFGLSLGIVQELAPFIGEMGLPMYFTEFYPKDKEYCVLGALFPGHIMGYIDKETLVLNNDILAKSLVLDNSIVEYGVQNMERDIQKAELYKKSNYYKQVTLWGNTTFTDREV
jgi:hypothetical protein